MKHSLKAATKPLFYFYYIKTQILGLKNIKQSLCLFFSSFFLPSIHSSLLFYLSPCILHFPQTFFLFFFSFTPFSSTSLSLPSPSPDNRCVIHNTISNKQSLCAFHNCFFTKPCLYLYLSF